jgi:AbiJ N-terminal domain 4
VNAQVETLTPDLRARLFNAAVIALAPEMNRWREGGGAGKLMSLWDSCWKQKISAFTMPSFRAYLEAHFAEAPWHSVLDTMEFVIPRYAPEMVEQVNAVFEQEKCSYRLLDDVIVPIEQGEQLDAVREAADGQTPSAHHLTKALQEFSARPAPNYANVVKDAIAAVEAEVRVIAARDKATLGEALKRCRDKLPAALIKAMEGLWGYASEVGGIRHAISDIEVTVGVADARFALTTCSALVTWLREHQASDEETL